jgi:hypothetical protein
MNAEDRFKENGRRFDQLQRDFEATGERFIRTELDMTQSLIDVGDSSITPEQRDRSYREAATGYRTILRTLPRIHLPRKDMERISVRLSGLGDRLRSKGLAVDEIDRP